MLHQAFERGQSVFDFGRASPKTAAPIALKPNGDKHSPTPTCWQYDVRQGSVSQMRPDNPKFQRRIAACGVAGSGSLGSLVHTSWRNPVTRCDRVTITGMIGRTLPPRTLVRLLLVAALLAVASSGCGATDPPGVGTPPLSLVARHAWLDGSPVWLKADLHTHTTFFDGALSIERNRQRRGRDRAALSSPSPPCGPQPPGPYAEYFVVIGEARKKYPRCNHSGRRRVEYPPYGGDEHVASVVELPQIGDEILSEFKARFDDYERNDVGADLTNSGPTMANGTVHGFQHARRGLATTTKPQTLRRRRIRWRIQSPAIGRPVCRRIRGAAGHHGAAVGGTLGRTS